MERPVTRTANSLPADPKPAVARGYDLIGDRYGRRTIESADTSRSKYERALIEGSFAESSLLNLGCGNGSPTTAPLASHFRTTAIEMSRRQALTVQSNLPPVRVICTDMTQVQFKPQSFEAVSEFFSTIHVPRDKHGSLLSSITMWIRAGGVMAATMMARSLDESWEADWLCAPMYWSGHDPETNLGLIGLAGLEVESAEVKGPDLETFLWVMARKPR